MPNIKLIEWNNSINYANKVCELFSHEYGVDVRPYIYTTYDNCKGIALHVIDVSGETFDQYYSGIQDNGKDLCNAIDKQISKILSEIS